MKEILILVLAVAFAFASIWIAFFLSVTIVYGIPDLIRWIKNHLKQ